jgi:galactokinase
MIATKVKQAFIDLYVKTPEMYFSPGRINIIGEHTDYNGGFVLPAAIDKGIYVAISSITEPIIKIHSLAFEESVTVKLAEFPDKGKSHWSDYVLGPVHQILEKGLSLGGFEICFDGDIPVGSGLSSSAAVECAIIFALNDTFNLQLSKIEMVKMAQAAEHAFVGVKCGIMDMYASMFSQKDRVIKLDCRAETHEYKPLNLGDYSILLINSMVKHNLASSAYNERRQQCEQGLAWIASHKPSVQTLRDVQIEDLQNYVKSKDSLIYQRCKYVIEENDRLQRACLALEKGDLVAVGKEMTATHWGLSKDYEVSCEELDFLVKLLENDSAVLGSRLMGGGFGGCTINLVKSSSIENIKSKVSLAYFSEIGIESEFYVLSPQDGTRRLN